jgi:hypothetical protein
MESYFPAWVARQEELLGELLAAPRHSPDRHLAAHRQLADRVLNHYLEYYQEKAHVASRDVLSLFSPSYRHADEPGTTSVSASVTGR